MTGATLNQIRHTLERAEFHLQSPNGLTVEKLRGQMGLGDTRLSNYVIELCDSKGLIEIEQTNYSTAHVKSVTPLGKIVMELLKTRIDEFEECCQSIEAQLDSVIVAVQPDEQLKRASAITPPGSPTRDMLRGRDS